MASAEVKLDKKIKKAKGPIRFEAIIPAFIFFALVFAYFFLFFDGHLRKGLEFALTKGNGAEVNVGSVKTSFWSASLEISNIQITNAEKPSHNSLEIGNIEWRMLWDGLLRGKIVIKEASVLNIQIDHLRKSPGFVLPPPPPPAPGEKSKMQEMKEKALANAETEFKQNIFGDIAGLLAGGSGEDQLKNIEGSLKSKAKILEVQEGLKAKEKEWQERLAKLPQGKDIQNIGDRVKQVKLSGFNSPQEVQDSLKQLDSIFRELDSKIKEIQGTTTAVQNDLGTYQNTLKEIESLVQQDLKDLEARLKIPKIDAQSLVRIMFGPDLLVKVHKAENYMNMARKYMPPKKSKEEKAELAPEVRERSKGINYKFGRPNSYPLFWLQLAKISSKATSDGTLGDMKGELHDLTDDQATLGKPTRLRFEGDFPAQKVSNVSGEIIVDHTTEKPVETASLNIGSFPIEKKMFTDTPDIRFGFNQASGSSQLKASLSGDQIQMQSNLIFQKIEYIVAAKQEILDQILKGATQDIPSVRVEALVSGSWSSPSFNLSSNLGAELQKAFEKQIKAQVNAAREKIKKLVDEQVGAKRAELEGQFNKIKDQVSNLLKQKEAEVNKAKGQVETAKNDASNAQTKKIEQEGQKVLDDIKKKLHF